MVYMTVSCAFSHNDGYIAVAVCLCQRHPSVGLHNWWILCFMNNIQMSTHTVSSRTQSYLQSQSWRTVPAWCWGTATLLHHRCPIKWRSCSLNFEDWGGRSDTSLAVVLQILFSKDMLMNLQHVCYQKAASKSLNYEAVRHEQSCWMTKKVILAAKEL